MSAELLSFPLSLAFYATSRANRNALALVLRRSDLPSDLRWDEILAFHDAVSASRRVQLDYVALLYKAWEATGGRAKNKLLPDGTKEKILNILAEGPKTITQIAEALGLSAPSVHTHVSDMLRSELLRPAVEWQKTHPAERYYEPNFPVFQAEECAEFRALCNEMAQQLVGLFERKRSQMERAFRKTDLPKQGWELSDITQCLFANMYRGARTSLEQRGVLSPREKHANGVQWIFWAEEAEPNGDQK